MSTITAEGHFGGLIGFLSEAWDSVKTGGELPEYRGPNPLWWGDVFTKTLAVADNTASLAQKAVGLIL